MENCSTSEAVDWHSARGAFVLQPMAVDEPDSGGGVISVLAMLRYRQTLD